MSVLLLDFDVCSSFPGSSKPLATVSQTKKVVGNPNSATSARPPDENDFFADDFDDLDESLTLAAGVR